MRYIPKSVIYDMRKYDESNLAMKCIAFTFEQLGPEEHEDALKMHLYDMKRTLTDFVFKQASLILCNF